MNGGGEGWGGGRVGRVGNLAPYSNTHTLQASPQENVGEGEPGLVGWRLLGGGGGGVTICS